MNKLFLGISLLFIYIIVIFFTVFWLSFLDTPIVEERDFHYILKKGTSAISLTDDLHKKTNLKFPKLFLLSLN